jgi:hypothetical protein
VAEGKKKMPHKVFGESLVDTMRNNTKYPIPYVAEQCILYLNQVRLSRVRNSGDGAYAHARGGSYGSCARFFSVHSIPNCRSCSSLRPPSRRWTSSRSSLTRGAMSISSCAPIHTSSPPSFSSTIAAASPFLGHCYKANTRVGVGHFQVPAGAAGAVAVR